MAGLSFFCHGKETRWRAQRTHLQILSKSQGPLNKKSTLYYQRFKSTLGGNSLRIRKEDIISAWAGLRPLVRDPKHSSNKLGNDLSTESLVRSHLIEHSPSGLITVAGGKWTTYRQMAQDTIDQAIVLGKLSPMRPHSQTEKIMLVGAHRFNRSLDFIRIIKLFGIEEKSARHLSECYGDRALDVASLAQATRNSNGWPVHGNKLLTQYPHLECEVIWACRQEYAVNAVDVLARRLNLSFLNAHAAASVVPRIIGLMAGELQWTPQECLRQRAMVHEHLLSMGLNILEPSRALFNPKEKTLVSIKFHEVAGQKKCNSSEVSELHPIDDNPLRITWSQLVSIVPDAKLLEKHIKLKVDPQHTDSFSLADLMTVLIILKDNGHVYEFEAS